MGCMEDTKDNSFLIPSNEAKTHIIGRQKNIYPIFLSKKYLGI